MKKITFLVGSLGVLVAITVLASGCVGIWNREVSEEAVERAIEKQSGEDVDIDTTDESTSITTDEGETTFGATEIPADFPDDVPIYTGATATYTHVGKGAEEETASATLQTTDDANQVKSWYESEIPKAGWNIESTDSFGVGDAQFTNFNAVKDNRELSVGISVVDNETAITIGVIKSEE